MADRPTPKPKSARDGGTDARLRRHGFAIHRRKGDEEPLWSRGGKVYPQRKALKVCDRELEPEQKE